MTPLEKANGYTEKNGVSRAHRPVYHVTAPLGWINDPNGFSVYQGTYHLFYQSHPYSNVWGPMHWGHCKSKDLITWEYLPFALAPDSPYDANGCFSGSAIETDNDHVLIYTGNREEEKDGRKRTFQTQCLAIGDGIAYSKAAENPVIDGSCLPKGFSREDFRDPKIWCENGVYYLVTCNRKSDGLGQVLLFRSEDLINWEYVTVLAENKGLYGKMWECPDFFPLDGSHVLIVSPQDMKARGDEFYNGDHPVYFTGKYDNADFKFICGKAVLLDHGIDFYAPQTLLSKDGRRIMIAWMQSWDAVIIPPEQKWFGMMTVPRELRLENGQLYQNPVRELDSCHIDPVCYTETEISGYRSFADINGRVLDMTLEVVSGEFERFSIRFAYNGEYDTSFTYFRSGQYIEFDRTYSGVEQDVVCQRRMKLKDPRSTLKLRLLLDKFSAELFVNGGCQTFSATFYTPTDVQGIVFYCDGSAKVNIEKYGIQTGATE